VKGKAMSDKSIHVERLTSDVQTYVTGQNRLGHSAKFSEIYSHLGRLGYTMGNRDSLKDFVKAHVTGSIDYNG
jgi:hypothetical protein